MTLLLQFPANVRRDHIAAARPITQTAAPIQALIGPDHGSCTSDGKCRLGQNISDAPRITGILCANWPSHGYRSATGRTLIALMFQYTTKPIQQIKIHWCGPITPFIHNGTALGLHPKNHSLMIGVATERLPG